jgi:DNA-binding CsgD family transcriptional regulator
MTSSEQFKSFFNTYSDKLQECDCNCGVKDFNILNNFHLMPRQALYIFDWKNRNIPYQRSIERLLGYSIEEFSPHLLAEYIHPEDSARYVHLVTITNEWARELKPEPFSVEVVIDYRVRKKDGRYLKVMRQSTIYENCRDRSPRSAFNMLTDITGIKTDNSVNLSIASLETGEVYLENRDQFPLDAQFSSREMDILLRLKKGSNSAAIAEELFISRHTVDTHRRNMLAKTGCRNVMEMVQKASRMGIV